MIQRNTKWTWWAGETGLPAARAKRHGLGDAGIHKDIDPTLTIDSLDQLGSKLKNLPKGWTFETKVLTEDLVLDTAEVRRLGVHAP